SRISGVGATKLREFSALFLREIAEHLSSNERLQFTASHPAEGRRSEPRSGRGRLGDSPASTLRQFRAGRSPEEIARERGFVLAPQPLHWISKTRAIFGPFLLGQRSLHTRRRSPRVGLSD